MDRVQFIRSNLVRKGVNEMSRLTTKAGLIGGALLLLLTACSPAEPAGQQDKTVIGFSMHNLIDERWQRDRDHFEASIREAGADVITLTAGGDESKQAAQAEKLLERGVDVLVIVAQNTESPLLGAVIEKAHSKGVKVLSYARLIKNADTDFYVSIDNVKVGELQAEEILKRAPQGNYVYIGGGQTDNNAVLLRDGSIRVLEKHKDRVTVVADDYSADWKPEEAYKHMKAALARTGGSIQGVVAANDGTAGAAVQALSELGLAGKVPVSGQDAELEALQRVVRGTQAMTIFLPIENMAKAAADAALAFAGGQEPVSNHKVPNGKKDVPSHLLEPVVVTKENVATTVVKAGYAAMEDVFQGIPKEQWPQP
ncbi:ABC-type ribose transport system, periplasmic component [Paenibacillus mucilaginosus KNP414]|uniref:ABC-type ribose transport system, periplasmic component n=2 Tax=Paenibacillus mucilaginosus TaxID=61624 RepID=F8FAM3_PAEMK|nr:ABC-type ribose transport system, periplasmic component [Paenibacillus mucilaginosus KNP414]